MVMLENSDQTTMTFYRYLHSSKARQILARYGYAPAS
jgi:ABC-type molybdate transport system substrate-binding protein